MSTRYVLSVVLAAAVLSFAGVSSSFAQSIPQEEIGQLDNSAVGVDVGASKGHDRSIVEQEKLQLGNFAGPNVKARAGKGGESLPQMEQDGVEF